jgi:molybdate transport system substrate-binding protein
MRRFAALPLVLFMATAGLAGGAAPRSLTVFGASSLTEFLDSAKKVFEKAHPGVTMRINIASSSQCRLQIQQGAPADVFMSADTTNMEPLVAAKMVSGPALFAFNRITVIVPKKNPAHIENLADLAKPKVKVVIGAADVPVGKYTRTVLDNMDASGKYGKDYAKRVLANVCSEEPAVKAVVTKVNLGEADAGFCYISDVTKEVRPNVRAFRIPDDVNVIATYPIAVLKEAKEPALAGEFMKFVLSKEGQKLLGAQGFLPLASVKGK